MFIEKKVESLPFEGIYLKEITLLGILSVFSFSIPFILGGPQILVGVLVNASLFFGSLFLSGKKLLPLCLFPALGVISRGVIFGPLTFFTLYFLPFIWMGNLLLVFTFRKLILKKGYLFSVILSSFLKALFLFLVAFLYFNLNLVPETFLSLMGVNQLLTALGGGLLSLLIFRSLYKN